MEKLPQNYTHLVLGVLIVIMTTYFCGCVTGSSGFPSEAKSPEQVLEYINTENLLAYITVEDSAIYITEGFEQVIADKLNARVNGDIWFLPEEEFGVPRPLRKLDWREYTPRLYIVKWTMYAGHDCKEKPAGTWVPHKNDKTGDLLFYYQLPAKKKICWRALKNLKKHVCKSVYEEITANISSGPNGEGERRRATFLVLVCFD